MRTLIALLLTTVLFVSCQNEVPLQQGEYEISGTIQNAAGQPLYLDQLTFKGNISIDTAIIANDGSYTMKGKVPENTIYALRLGQDKIWLLVMDGGKIRVESDGNNPYEASYEGSQTSSILNEFRSNFLQTQTNLGQLQQTMFQAQTQGGVDPQQFQQQQAKYNQGIQDLQNSVKAFIDTVSSPLSAVFACGMTQINQDMPLFEKVVNRLKKEAPDSPLSKEFIAAYNQQVAETKRSASVSAGNKAPDFTLKSPTGESLSLSGMEGEVILVDFWASWCRPCRKENPNLVRTYNKYKSKGFDIYSVSLDKNMQKWVSAIKQDNLTWKTHGSELKGWSCSVSRTYSVRSIPATFLLDKDGKILATNLRGNALDNKLKEIYGF